MDSRNVNLSAIGSKTEHGSQTGPSVSRNEMHTSSKLDNNKLASELVTMIRDMVTEEVRTKVASYELAEVVRTRPNNRYDVKLTSDPDKVLENVADNTNGHYIPGDYVYLCKIGNNLVLSYIAFAYYKAERSDMTDLQKTVGAGLSKTVIKETTLDYKKKHWYVTFSTDLVETIRSRGYTKVQIGVSRVLSQKSTIGRCRWMDTQTTIDKENRRTYSLGQEVSIHRRDENGNRCYYLSNDVVHVLARTNTRPRRWQWYERAGHFASSQSDEWVVDEPRYGLYPIMDRVPIMGTFNFPAEQIDCGFSDIIQIDVTDIVNNYIYSDCYNLNRSWRRSGSSASGIQKAFDEFEYWWKKFGIYIKACSASNELLYVTPIANATTIRMKQLENPLFYNPDDLTQLSAGVFVLDSTIATGPYSYDNRYVPVDIRTDTHIPAELVVIKISSTSNFVGRRPVIVGLFERDDGSRDWAEIPLHDVVFSPSLLAGNKLANVRYTARYKLDYGTSSITTTFTPSSGG